MKMKIQSNIDIVIYALGKLGGSTKKVPTEHIAKEAFKLAPNRFSWIHEEFEEYPDKLVTKTALEDAAKKKFGELVKGGYARDVSKDGWVLTPNGVRWLRENQERIAEGLERKTSKIPKLSPVEVNRFRSRINKDQAFQIYKNSGALEGVSRYMFANLLQASPDADNEIYIIKFSRLLSLAEMAQDNKIIEFLRACRNHFSYLLDNE